MKLALEQNLAIREVIRPRDRALLMQAIENGKTILVDMDTDDGKALAYKLEEIDVPYQALDSVYVYRPQPAVKHVPAKPAPPKMFQFPTKMRDKETGNGTEANDPPFKRLSARQP